VDDERAIAEEGADTGEEGGVEVDVTFAERLVVVMWDEVS